MSDKETTSINFNGIGCLVFIILVAIAPASCTLAEGYSTKLKAEAAAIEKGCRS